MPRPAWTLYAYQLIEPDDQLDLFACREVRVQPRLLENVWPTLKPLL